MNKKERLTAIFDGLTPDKTPAGFWCHYPNTYTPEETARAHIDLFKSIDSDIIKVMDDTFGRMLITGIKIETAADLRNIVLPGRDCGQYRDMVRVIELIAAEVGKEVMIFPTMWSPFKIAMFAIQSSGGNDESFMQMCKEDPESVTIGVNKIGEAVADWVEGYLAAGADGLYYAGQFSEPQRFSAEEWKALVSPSDLIVINRVKALGGRVFLHICGEVEHGFNTSPERYISYPSDIVNWDVHRNTLSLEDGQKLFQKPVLGGMDNHGVLIEGTTEEIAAEAKRVTEKFGKKGFMLGADCTIPATLDHAKLRSAISAAKSV